MFTPAWLAGLQSIATPLFRYPTAGQCGSIGGRVKYRVSARAVPAAPRPAILASGIPGKPSATVGGAVSGVPPKIEAIELIGGAIAVQVGGTDSEPIEAAWPAPADTAPLRPPSPPSGPPSPAAAACPSASPAALPPLAPSRLRKGATVLLGMKKPDENMVFQILAFGPSGEFISQPRMSVDPDEDDAPDPVNAPSISPLPDNADPDDAGEARFCRAGGTPDISCDSAVCVLVLADVPVAWVTAAAWSASPPTLVFCCGALNAVSWVATADDPA